MGAKNIVICADGTGNTFETNVSNVVRLVRSLQLRSPKTQLVLYDQGVGTKAKHITAATEFKNRSNGDGFEVVDEPKTWHWIPRFATRWLGLGFGYGVYENVAELYSRLAAHYVEGDRVYLFGFSRGAFTVRVLAGLIHRCGLLDKNRLSLFSEAYRLYKPHYEWVEDPDELERLKTEVAQFKSVNNVRECPIRFLGIWDTVKSYGFIYPRSLPHLRHNSNVLTVRHALALDEQRSYYLPTSWGGVDHPTYDDVRRYESRDVNEVWFAGSHSDVGGGYPRSKSGLALASFDWMVQEARAYELCVNEPELDKVLSEFPERRAVNESLKWLWWLGEIVRFEIENIPLPGIRRLKWGPSGPRSVEQFSRDGEVLVHASARELYPTIESFVANSRTVGTRRERLPNN